LPCLTSHGDSKPTSEEKKKKRTGPEGGTRKGGEPCSVKVASLEREVTGLEHGKDCRQRLRRGKKPYQGGREAEDSEETCGKRSPKKRLSQVTEDHRSPAVLRQISVEIERKSTKGEGREIGRVRRCTEPDFHGAQEGLLKKVSF